MSENIIAAILLTWASVCGAESAKGDDPFGILKKPIPERLVVFTFDDGCASHATIAAPILKKHGFNGTFYVSDAYLFRERKDWYMTWRQIRTMSEQGFEIGNHTRGHGQLSMTDVGGCQAYVWTLEDAMIANRIPRPTTFCWPFYDTNPKFYPLLQSWGYTFARGGHGRTYDPTKDNPFDVPSFAAGGVGQTIDGLISAVQQAVGGRIVVITFHGTPDMEHAGVGIDPDIFEDLVEYMKDNHYKVIAMRDLVEYIDPVKAAQLPPTKTPPRSNQEKAEPLRLVQGDKPFVPSKRKRRGYTFPEELTGLWTVKEIYRLRLPDAVTTAINGTTITMIVPPTADVTALAPVFELARFATAAPASGTVRNFSTPQVYKITAQDGSTKDYTVKAVPSATPVHFTWTAQDGGNFDDGSNWKNQLGVAAGPAGEGNADAILNFAAPGSFSVTRESPGDFVLNQLNCTGSFPTWIGSGTLVFTKSGSSMQPYMNSQARSEVTIKAPIRLDADLIIDGLELDDTRVFLPGVISGKGGLIKEGPHSLHVSNPTNTYSGGTIVNDGSLSVQKQGLGTGPVAINNEGAIGIGGDAVMNPLTANGGKIFSGGNGRWSGPVTLKGNTKLSCPDTLVFDDQESGISGPGGLTQTGHRVDHGTKSGTIKLFGRNTYTGPTLVEMGLMEVMGSLYNNEPDRWTPANITVNGAAGELRLHVGGPSAFTAAQAETMLKNLTTDINQNGLLERSTFGIDTTGATVVQELAVAITDSKGPGGGGIHFKKCGAGTLKLSGANTFSGQTRVEGGTLSVESLNSVVKGRPSSSLGAPTSDADGEIFISGGSTLTYTGKGETTDRTLNLPGAGDTITLDQSGTGLLKLTSPFVMSGYGENKTIVLAGSGAGELAFPIDNVYDRQGKATTAITKTGAGNWTLSGENTYTGPTVVKQGTLLLPNANSLGDKTDVSILPGGMLDLSFSGEMRIIKLELDGKPQASGTYDADNSPKFIKGKGVLKIQ
jgi:autotransporter-associated beta strand protein